VAQKGKAYEGTISIDLSDHDAAVVMRSDGTMESYIPHESGGMIEFDSPAYWVAALSLCLGSEDAEIHQLLIKKFDAAVEEAHGVFAVEEEEIEV
jgi:hypothetical protein